MGDRDREPVECGFFEVLRTTQDAILVSDDGEDGEWIPRSQVSDESEIRDDAMIGDEGTLWLPEWLANEKGLV